MLPFQVKKRIIKVENLAGVDGAVYFRPWTLLEYETISAERQAISDENTALDLMCNKLAQVLVNADGVSPGDPKEIAAQLKSLDAPTVAALWESCVKKCGISGNTDDPAKN